MKKVNLTGKLSLRKETVAKLNDEQMNFLKGGGGPTTVTVTVSNATCAGQNTCQVVVVHTVPVGCAVASKAGNNSCACGV